jgi:RimJ/RimL family protein N-acetyltransferase
VECQQQLVISEDNFIDFKCPQCGETASFPGEDVGKLRACPNCLEDLIVPEAGAQLARKLPLPILTPRLTLRRFAPGDWKDLLEFMPDEELFRYAGQPMHEEEILAWLERDSRVRLTTQGQTFCLGIVDTESNKVAGYAGLALTDPLQAMLQIFLSRSYQKQGLAIEAVDALLGFCFEGIKLHRVAATCDSRNTAARKLFERVGMRREAEFVKDTPGVDGWLSSVWYGALEEEYLEPGAGAPQAGSGPA